MDEYWADTFGHYDSLYQKQLAPDDENLTWCGVYGCFKVKNERTQLPYAHYSERRWNTPRVIYGNKKKTVQHVEYSDRLHQWHGNAAHMEVNEQFGGHERTVRWHRAWLSRLYDSPVELVWIMTGCNISSGYDYYIYGFNTPQKKEETHE